MNKWFRVTVVLESGRFSKMVFASDKDEACRIGIKQIQTEESGKALSASGYRI